jgi:hypothetical protein
MNRETIDQLAKKLAAVLPRGLGSLRSELEENFRAVLKSGLARMDLVTREEFAVQEAVLQRTREKLEALEQRLQALSDAQETVPAAGRKKKAATNRKKKTGQPEDSGH